MYNFNVMNSILSGSFEKEVTIDWLKELGFSWSYWGRPLGVTYKNGVRKVDWHKHQRCWDYFEDTSLYYVGHLIYFPDKFKGFINYNCKSENPAGYVYIQIENDDSGWIERIRVECQSDVEAAFAIMKQKSEEMNKNTWSYNWTR